MDIYVTTESNFSVNDNTEESNVILAPFDIEKSSSKLDEFDRKSSDCTQNNGDSREQEEENRVFSSYMGGEIIVGAEMISFQEFLHETRESSATSLSEVDPPENQTSNTQRLEQDGFIFIQNGSSSLALQHYLESLILHNTQENSSWDGFGDNGDLHQALISFDKKNRLLHQQGLPSSPSLLRIDSEASSCNETNTEPLGSGSTENGASCCSICYGDMTKDSTYTCPSCDSSACLICFKNYVRTQINSGYVTSQTMKCMSNSSCARALTEEEIRGAVSTEIYEKHRKHLCRLDNDMWLCPDPECEHVNEKPGLNARKIKKASCDGCHKTWCIRCGRKWSKSRLQCRTGLCSPENSLSYKFWSMFKNVRHCPKCRTVIEKNGGCKHMHCRNCDYDFMWCCKQPYHNHKSGARCAIQSVAKCRWAIFGPTKPVRFVTKTVAGVAVAGTVVGVVVAGGVTFLIAYGAFKGGRRIYKLFKR